MLNSTTTRPAKGASLEQADQRDAQRRAEAIRILLALAEVDPTISGATLIQPDGTVMHIDAATLRRGGRA